MSYNRLIKSVVALTALTVTALFLLTASAAATVPPVGTVVAWGANSGANVTVVPPGLSDVTAIAAGDTHSLALRADGTVVAWGSDWAGQTDVPAGLSGALAVAAGWNHSLALKADGSVVAWGYNYSGQTNVPAGLSGVIGIAAGSSFSVALEADGTVIAWGGDSPATFVPAGLSGVTAIAAGDGHCLALKSDGSVVAWGADWAGQTDVPAGLSGVIAVAAGGSYSLALKDDGTVVGWGWNAYGQTSVPAGLGGVIKIAAGLNHALALKADGTVIAWGNNSEGETNVPAGLSGVIGIAGGSYHSLALVGAPLDSTPPHLTAPGETLVDATSSAGAVVTYSVTATDTVDPNPSVSCVPTSGSTFPIGDTTVNCIATDASHNTDTASFTVHVKGADEQVSDLSAQVDNFALVKLGTSLHDKLIVVQEMLRSNHPAQACEELNSFLNEVKAQTGKGLTADQERTFTVAAQRIRNVIAC